MTEISRKNNSAEERKAVKENSFMPKRRFMKKKVIAAFSMLLCAAFLGGCGDKSSAPQPEQAEEVSSDQTVETLPEQAEEVSSNQAAELPDGTYTAEFKTDSSMFHVSEACDGKGTLTVENGKMVIHISLGSKKILNLYPGLAEDAAKEGEELLLPTEDTVTYSDGMTEGVYGFDVPVPALDEEFDLALIGTKGVWYDHKVSVSAAEPLPGEADAEEEKTQTDAASGVQGAVPGDGTYTVEVGFEGGSGKAQILSPVTITITGGKIMAEVQWNSPNYDYMIVDGEKYLPVNTEGDSVFEIPVSVFDEPVNVIGDTVAMSKPHEVEYALTFYSDTMKAAE